MNYSLVYAAHRFVFRVVDFFHHWYVDASRAMAHRLALALERFDRRNRSAPARALAGAALSAAACACFLVIFVAWLALPLVILFFVFDRLPGR